MKAKANRVVPRMSIKTGHISHITDNKSCNNHLHPGPKLCTDKREA